MSSGSRMRRLSCRICGGGLPSGKLTLCGAEHCARLARNEKQRTWDRKSRRLGTSKNVAKLRECRECAKPCRSRKLYCSDLCKTRRNRRRGREYYRRNHAAVVAQRLAMPCAYCEWPFVPQHAGRIYCSAQCSRKVERDERSLRRLLVSGTGISLREIPVSLRDAAMVLRRFNQEAWRIYAGPKRSRQSAA